MPSFEMMLTLIPWGHLLDRVGERIVLALGLGLTAVAGFAAASVHSVLMVGAILVLGGMSAMQNTFERLMAAVAPPAFAELIVAAGYRRRGRGAACSR